MATLSVDIPAGQTVRVMNAVAYVNGYADQVRDGNGNLIPNPETKAQFGKRMVIQYLKNCVKQYEAVSAAKQARESAETAVDNEVNLT